MPAASSTSFLALQMCDCAQADERLGDRLDRHRGHQAHVLETTVLEHPAHEDPVHHRAEHPDVVGLGPLDRPLVGDVAAEEVAPADDDRLLDAEVARRDQLLGDVAERLAVEPEVHLRRRRRGR